MHLHISKAFESAQNGYIGDNGSFDLYLRVGLWALVNLQWATPIFLTLASFSKKNAVD